MSQIISFSSHNSHQAITKPSVHKKNLEQKDHSFECIIPFFSSVDVNIQFAIIEHQIFGLRLVVINENNDIYFLPLESITSPFNTHVSGLELIKNIPIEDIPNFVFLFNPKEKTVQVLPKLLAAGKEGSLNSSCLDCKGLRNSNTSMAIVEYALNKLVEVKELIVDKEGNEAPGERTIILTVSATQVFKAPMYLDEKGDNQPIRDSVGNIIYNQVKDFFIGQYKNKNYGFNNLKNFSGDVPVIRSDKPLLAIRIQFGDKISNSSWFGFLPPKGTRQHYLDQALELSFYKREARLVGENNLLLSTNPNTGEEKYSKFRILIKCSSFFKSLRICIFYGFSFSTS